MLCAWGGGGVGVDVNCTKLLGEKNGESCSRYEKEDELFLGIGKRYIVLSVRKYALSQLLAKYRRGLKLVCRRHTRHLIAKAGATSAPLAIFWQRRGARR